MMARHYELTRPVTQAPSLSLARNTRHPAPGPNYTECHLANLAGPDPGTNNLHTSLTPAWARNASETRTSA